MRFRIMKNTESSAYSIVVSGVMDDAAGSDILQVAQTILNRPGCIELTIDLRSASINRNLSLFNTEILASVFEEELLRKDSAVIIRYRHDREIRFCSDQLPLETSSVTKERTDEAKFIAKIMRWLDQDDRFLIN